ncbi:MAG: alpha/beta fold hydrolase [Gemmatimonadota bacterium]|jgi:3-oxoadipate enol-lactonase
MNLHVRASVPASDGSAGTVVFVHGFPFDGSMWERQLAGLPPGWNGLAPDLRGFGQSDIHDLPGEVSTGRRTGGRVALRDEPVLTMARFADDVATLIEDRIGEPAAICGLSMGGYVALEIRRRHPDLVRALILTDTRARSDDDEARENRLRTAQTVRSAGARPVATAMLPALLSPGSRERPDLVEQVRNMILATPPASLIGALAGMAARHDHTGELGSIAVPTLVVVGDEDGITPPDEARDMTDAIPGARMATIEHAGHLAPLEQPEAFNRILAGFLEALAA